MLRRRAAAPGVETRLRKRLRPASRSPEATPAPDDPAVDPRLMTERQQLAFLLRATAHDASSSSATDEGEDDENDDEEDDANEDEDSSEASGEDEARPRALRRLRRAADVRAVSYRGRGRPRKISAVSGDDKENARDEPDADEPWHTGGKLPPAATLSVKRADKVERSKAKISADALAPEAKIPADAGCALCCRGERLVVDATAPLFLCARCDRKYPTQQALGRPCAA